MKPVGPLICSLVLLASLCPRHALGLYSNVKEIKTVEGPKEFEELLSSKKVCLVQFYATWCRASRGFANDFTSIAKTIKDDITILAVKNEDIINQYKIETYPSIHVFFANDSKKNMEKFDGNYKIKEVVSFVYDSIKKHRLKELNIDLDDMNKSSYKKKGKKKKRWKRKKKSHSAIEYNDSRTVEDMYQFFLKYYSEKKEVIQLTSQQVFDEYCEKDVCLLAILPNKEDTELSYFKSYVQILTNVIKDVSTLPVTFLWTQAGDQLDIVQKLNLTFGFPTVIAISFSKNVYSILKGNYSEQSIRNFITQMMMGKSSVDNLVPFTVKTVPKFSFTNAEEANSEL
ncbi:Protein disulfide isomerase [Plasmodium coatneyi]|uniref:protein disulfide-isomerase n=1 Tax=Plasmodium coatneyi TaxID=208452 RepID=A0A1B1DZW4_9APIC|nr:Protein disulfide isomerase [Plasmodium coatneyi]ANQ08323.1 Protein disulfide isomerase [Plasmodium coatneyi]